MKTSVLDSIQLIDLCSATDTFRHDVRDGLQQQQKVIPAKFFYDVHGSRLFDQITELPEYYLTRVEMGIMRRFIDEMVERMGPRTLLVEYGSGSSLKTRILLNHLPESAGYVPIDISKEHLLRSATALAAAYPDLPILPVCADYTTDLHLPEFNGAHPVVYFPGSTIGNFSPDQATAFLRHIAEVAGPGGGLLIGVDLKKDIAILEAAYNDSQGITAAFNKNMLERINRELGGAFDLDLFGHRAFYNYAHGRIEMHLLSLVNQVVRVGSWQVQFRCGETILTEYSYKYSLDEFAALAGSAGFKVERVWTDDAQLFSVQYLVAGAGRHGNALRRDC